MLTFLTMIWIIRKLMPYFRPYRSVVLWGLFFVVLSNAFQVLNPWVLRLAINGLEQEIRVGTLWEYAWMLLGVAVGAGLFKYLMRRTVIGTSRRVEFDMRQRLLRHLLKLDPAFYDRSRIGDLMTRSTSDIEQVRMVYGPALMYTVNTIFGFLFGAIMMYQISPLLTALVLLVGPFVAVMVFFIGRRIHRASTASQEAYSDLSAAVQENLSGMRVVQAFRQAAPQEKRFDERADWLKRKNIHLVLLRGLFMPAIMLVFGVAVAGIMLLGGHLIIRGTLLVGDFVAFVSYLMMLTWPMISIGWVVSLFQRGRASLERIDSLLQQEPELVDGPHREPAPGREGTVEYRDVQFTYPRADRPALRDISFEVEKGMTLGVVGRVGCGKSSIAHLMTRLYDAQQGQVLVDGRPVEEWDRNALRRRITVVPQEPLLFSMTLRENITLGGEFSDEEVERAVEISRLVQDMEEFPEGLGTEIGERGITLSGGQKQRVSIARAVIREPEIIIFDDALSAVDAETEEKIMANLARFVSGRTAVIISHRLSSVARADEILVLESGAIAQRGKHDRLMEEEGVYRDLFLRQRMAQELEGAA